MKLEYKLWLKQELYRVMNDNSITGFNIEVDNEQSFIKNKDLKPDTIYVLIKYLSNDIQFNSVTQPIQMLILTEENSMDMTRLIFNLFIKKWNFNSNSYDDEFYKHQYSEPVALSNFNTVDYGYRSVLYVSANLYIIEDVLDVTGLKIDDVSVEALGFQLTYSMTPNTQQIESESISKSIKNASSLSVSLSVPMTDSALVNKVLSILNETDTLQTGQTNNLYFGNENFKFDWWFGNATASTGVHFQSKNFKLISAQIITAPNQVPSLNLGFIK